MIAAELSRKDMPIMLFRDYNGYWAPLNQLYWSQSSEMLVARQVNSCIEESISHYCPQCLTRYSDDEVHNYLNRCPSCFQCPYCETVVTAVSKSASQCILLCNTCYWKSDDNGLYGSDKADLEMKIRKREKEQASSKDFFHFYLRNLQEKDIHGLHANILKSNELSKLHHLHRRGHSFSKANWQLSDIEARVEKKANAVTCKQYALYNNSECDQLVPPNKRIDASTAARKAELSNFEACYTATIDSEVTSVEQRMLDPTSHPYKVNQLLPPRILLSSKRTVRCRQDVEENKMNILIQPKTFPLEGDSSLKIQRGKWWVKDSSAIHELPNYMIKKLPSRDEMIKNTFSYLEIAVTNPRESEVNLAFVSAFEYNMLDDTDDFFGEMHDEYLRHEHPQLFDDLKEKMLSPKSPAGGALSPMTPRTFAAQPTPRQRPRLQQAHSTAILHVATTADDFVQLQVAARKDSPVFGEGFYLKMGLEAYEDELLRDSDDVKEDKIVKLNSKEKTAAEGEPAEASEDKPGGAESSSNEAAGAAVATSDSSEGNNDDSSGGPKGSLRRSASMLELDTDPDEPYDAPWLAEVLHNSATIKIPVMFPPYLVGIDGKPRGVPESAWCELRLFSQRSVSNPEPAPAARAVPRATAAVAAAVAAASLGDAAKEGGDKAVEKKGEDASAPGDGEDGDNDDEDDESSTQISAGMKFPFKIPIRLLFRL